MNISDFAKQRNIEPQAVSRYISRHPEIKEHTKKDGKMVELLPEAERLLDEVYPLPKPVHVVQGVPQEEYEAVLKKLAQQQEIIIKLQQERIEDQKQIAKAEATQLLLEDKERQLNDLREQREQSLIQIEEEKERTRAADQRAEDAQKEIERLKNRSLWERIRNI